MGKKSGKVMMRSLVVLLFAFLPMVALVFYFQRQETEDFLLKNTLFDDVSFSTQRVYSHSVKLLKDEAAEGNVYTVYIPSEYAAEPVITYQHASQVWINGKEYASGDELVDIAEGTAYPIELLSEVSTQKETGTVTFYFSENVPTLYVDTNSGSMEAINASVDHSYAEVSTYLAIEADGTVSGSGQCSIKGRGNSTWAHDFAIKKPYNIEMDSAVPLFGMGSQGKWNLMANCYDGSQLRSWLAYDVAQKLDMPVAVETRFVNVYFNGSYNGLYLLTQHIDISGGNVDIYDLNKDNEVCNGNEIPELIREYDEKGRAIFYYSGVSPDEITGGYLLEYVTNTASLRAGNEPWFQMDHNNALIESPKYPTKEEVAYISEYMDKVEDSIFNTTDDSYRKYLDFDSWVNMYYMREFFSAWDGETNSSYVYKDRNSDVLYNGPAWDYDLSMGQTWGAHSPFTSQCMWLETKTQYSWLQKLKTDHSDYREEVEKRYYDVFLPLITEEIHEVLPTQYEYIKKSAQVDCVRYPMSVRMQYPGDFQEEYDYLQWWLQDRTDFFTDYLQNPEDYVQFIIKARNSFICYVKPGTVLTQLPNDDGKEARWYYEDGTEVKVGDVIDRPLTITSEYQVSQ